MKKKIILASLMMFLGGGSLFAATVYGTNITNTASLSFSVGGQGQAPQTSNTDAFVVDRKVDLTVTTTDTTNALINPGENDTTFTTPLSFTITNTSNGRQDVILSASNKADNSPSLTTGEIDNIDFTPYRICENVTCSTGDKTGQNVKLLTDGASVTYYLFAKASGVNNDIASMTLTATAVNNDGITPLTQDTGADNQTAVQIVFADGAGDTDAIGDGKHSAFSAYKVVSAVLALTKGSCVISDPINLLVNPKRIPGATVRYTFQVDNTGGFQATNVVVTDTLDGALTFPGSNNVVNNTACDCKNMGGTLVSGSSVTASGQNVTADFDTVPAPASGGTTSYCAYFDTTIL